MKTLIARLAVLTLAAAALTGPLAPSARAEGGRAGGGMLPPPLKIVIVTPDFVIWDNGMIVYTDGTIGHLPMP